MPIEPPNVRDVLNEAATSVARTKHLGRQQAKAYVHNKLLFEDLILHYENLCANRAAALE